MLGHEVVDVGEHIAETNELLSNDDLFSHLVVQRSRAYAKESQINENKSSAVFPEYAGNCKFRP